MRWTILLLTFSSVPAQVFGASHVYASLASSLITSLNISSGSQAITGTAGLNARTFFLAPDGKTFFVTGAPSTLQALNPFTGTKASFKTTYPVFTNFLSTTPFAVTPSGSRLLAGTCANDYQGVCEAGFVEIFDTATTRQLAVISFGGDEVSGIAVTPDGHTAYVTHLFQSVCAGCDSRRPASTIPSTSITAVSLATLTAGNSLSLGEVGLGGPGKVVIDPTGALAYVAPAFGAGELAVVNLPQLTLASQVQIAGGARLALTANGSILCATTSAYTLGGSNDLMTFYNAPRISTIGSVSLPGYSGAGLAVDPAGKFAYIGNAGTGFTYQVNIASLSISASVATGSPIDLALSASESLYALSSAGASVAVFDETSSAPSHVIPTRAASYLTVSPNGGKIYLNPYNSGVVSVSVLSGATLATYLAGYSILSTALSPDGATLFAGGYTAFTQENYFFVVDLATGTLEKQISSSGSTPTVAISADGKTVLINGLNSKIAVYNVAKGTIDATLPVKAGDSLAINPAGTLAYVGALLDTPQISVIDLITNKVAGTIATPCQEIVFSPFAPVAYAWGNGTLSAIDTRTNTVTSSVPLQAGLGQGPAISADGRYLYTSGTFGATENSYLPGSIIDAPTLRVVGVMPTLNPLVAH